MNIPINDGGPAFPFACQGPTTAPEFYYGMTLRDYFAATETLTEWDNPEAQPIQAMCEALAGQPKPSHGWACSSPDQWLTMFRWEAKWRAALKYIRADAMIAASGGNAK